MKAAPKFKEGDVIVTEERGSLRAKVYYVTDYQYILQFDYAPNSNQLGTIEVFDRDYILEDIRNSPLYKALL